MTRISVFGQGGPTVSIDPRAAAREAVRREAVDVGR
jgi:hypothetical protein